CSSSSESNRVAAAVEGLRRRRNAACSPSHVMPAYQGWTRSIRPEYLPTLAGRPLWCCVLARSLLATRRTEAKRLPMTVTPRSWSKVTTVKFLPWASDCWLISLSDRDLLTALSLVVDIVHQARAPDPYRARKLLVSVRLVSTREEAQCQQLLFAAMFQ